MGLDRYEEGNQLWEIGNESQATKSKHQQEVIWKSPAVQKCGDLLQITHLNLHMMNMHHLKPIYMPHIKMLFIFSTHLARDSFNYSATVIGYKLLKKKVF